MYYIAVKKSLVEGVEPVESSPLCIEKDILLHSKQTVPSDGTANEPTLRQRDGPNAYIRISSVIETDAVVQNIVRGGLDKYSVLLRIKCL